ncbi:MAG: nucleoside phosphorylase [Bacteroidales bacterium]|nr:nucleoside phosphorylase [Bacteroidales bacterium]
MINLAEPDLIVNADGSVYHLSLRPDQLAETVLIMGDPGRVPEVSVFFDSIECNVSNREFISHTGMYRGKRITALSTGIGTDNIDIVMQELDALANFNLQTRLPNPERKTLTIIRLGTSGAIQPDITINSFGLSTHAMGLDNVIYFYRDYPNIIDKELSAHFARQVNWSPHLTLPYFIKGSEGLVQLFSKGTVPGITVTAPGFYGPQGRGLHLALTDPEMINKLQQFQYGVHRITNFEMETSALYGLGALMGHETITICALVANRATGEYNPSHGPVISALIEMVLDRIITDS